MSAILQELEPLRRDAEESLALAQTGDATRTWHGDYLGRKGRMTALLRTLGSLPAEERAQAGKAANDVKVALEAALEERQDRAEAAAAPAPAPRAPAERAVSHNSAASRTACKAAGFQAPPSVPVAPGAASTAAAQPSPPAHAEEEERGCGCEHAGTAR